MKTFLFYDIETTGLNKAFDQILQFAAIRTDLGLNELNRYDIKVKLNPDVIPSPSALITHQIGIGESLAGIPEIDAIKQIHSLMNEPGTISLGYNTLGFDDEFLRFSFHRNLLPPYTHQYANGCGRMDIYPMTVMYFLYHHSTLKWPTTNSKISLKLEKLNEKNQFVKGRSHHAMIDVEVTLALAKHLFSKNTTWDYLTGYFDKKIDQKRCLDLENQCGLMIDGLFGSAEFFQHPVLLLGIHPHYKNQIWLQLDTLDFTQTTPLNIQKTTRIINKKLGEPSFILPLKERFIQYLSHERLTLVESNKTWLQKNPQLHLQIKQFYENYRYPHYPNVDVEASLYLNGFLKSEEEKWCRHFHAANISEKISMTDRLTNPILQALATRIVGRHYPADMTSLQKERFAIYMKQVNAKSESEALIDYRGKPRLSPTITMNEIIELKKDMSLTTHQLTLLDELESYLLEKFARLT